jgi:hypothetical protein
MLRSSAGDSGVEVFGILVGAVVFVIAIIARPFGLGEPDPNKYSPSRWSQSAAVLILTVSAHQSSNAAI